MCCAQQPRLLVHVTDRTQVSPHDFEIGVLTSKVDGHLEHSQMKICHWTERTASYEHDWLPSAVPHDPSESVRRECVAVRSTTHRGCLPRHPQCLACMRDERRRRVTAVTMWVKRGDGVATEEGGGKGSINTRILQQWVLLF